MSRDDGEALEIATAVICLFMPRRALPPPCAMDTYCVPRGEGKTVGGDVYDISIAVVRTR